MRLKHLYISNYKNLNVFSIDFEGNNFIDVFVGKNGTGKSNLFEAMLEIFRHLYEDDYVISFEYRLKYELNDDNVFIEWKEEKWINEEGNEVTKIRVQNLPDHILIYYSGHNEKVVDLIDSYESKFKNSLNRNRTRASMSPAMTRRFIGVGNEYKSILLSVLLLQRDGNTARQFIIDKLGIQSIGDELKIVLKRPDYASSAEFDFDEVDQEKRFWGAEGVSRNFLDVLWNADKNTDPPARKEGFIVDEDQYYFYRNISSLQNQFRAYQPQQIFRGFDTLKAIGMLEDVSIQIELNNGVQLDLNQFSDGQFQSIYIYTITELYKDQNCIVLLDEPDSFLHPEWQFDFLSQVKEISAESSESNHVLMTSHSAVTLLNSSDRHVRLLDFHDADIKCYPVQKEYAVRKLASRLVKLNADKQILSIIHSISQDRSVLFTEGYSDPMIINEAWNQLYDDEMPFDVYFGFGCQYLRFLLQDESILNEMSPHPIFGLFDFDGAYNEWNSIPSDGLIQADPFLGLTKQTRDKNSYAILIPVPEINEVEGQVIRDKAAKTTFEGDSHLEVEHLFYCDDTIANFHDRELVGGGSIKEFNQGQKMEFAKEIVPTMDQQMFEVFRPMFDFIQSKLNT